MKSVYAYMNAYKSIALYISDVTDNTAAYFYIRIKG